MHLTRFLALLLLAGAAQAATPDTPTVYFRMKSFTGRDVNYPFTLKPYSPLAVSGTNLITGATWKITPTNGIAWVSNLVAGDYLMRIEATAAEATITVPATNAVLDAATLVSVTPSSATGLAYSKTASDARYALKEEASNI